MAKHLENPYQALENKRHIRTSPLSSAEQVVHDWYIRNPQNAKQRELAYSMRDMGAFIKDFGGPFPEVEVERDKKEIKSLRNKEGNIYKTEQAEILEAVFEKWAKDGNWFGDDCEIVPTLEYDDRKNHTDFVLVIRREDGEIIRMAVDCTVTEDNDVLRKKAFYTVKGIEENNLASIKYFSDPNTKKKQEVGMLPRVIAAVEKDKLDELCRSFLTAIKGGSGRIEKDSFFQFYLLKEFESQLDAQLQVVDNLPQEFRRTKYAQMKKNIELAKKTIKDIISKKESSLDKKVLQRAKDEITDSRNFMVFPPLYRKPSRELRY